MPKKQTGNDLLV